MVSVSYVINNIDVYNHLLLCDHTLEMNYKFTIIFPRAIGNKNSIECPIIFCIFFSNEDVNELICYYFNQI